jgi:hypothetical protein
VAVKIPYGSTLRPLKNALSPFKTEIPEVLRRKYGGTKLSRKLRTGLLKAEQVLAPAPLHLLFVVPCWRPFGQTTPDGHFAHVCSLRGRRLSGGGAAGALHATDKRALIGQSPLFQRDAAQFRTRSEAGLRSRRRGRSGHSEDADGGVQWHRQSSMKSMLQRLALKVDKISRKTSNMDSTLGRVTDVLHYGH